MTRAVYRFAPGVADGDATMKELLGGKGANLAEMSVAGLPVPPGFTITTEVCRRVLESAVGKGGAVIPPVMGLVSDASTINTAMLIPALCFAAVFFFAWKSRRDEVPATALTAAA